MGAHRRAVLAALLSAATVSGCGLAPQRSRKLTVYKTASCDCCNGWIEHMRKAGYTPDIKLVEDVSALSTARGIPFEFSSCHMGEIGDYVLLGHIPSADVDRLLAERPLGIGLSLPGMPLGSPGMESDTGETEAYEVILMQADGKTSTFARHA